MVKLILKGIRRQHAADWNLVADTDTEHVSGDKDLDLTTLEKEAWDQLDAEGRRLLMKDTMKLHRTTGHRPPRAMVRTLRRRGATPA
eukprot:15446916-Alexandrium_andersonii.AAC.1